MNFRGAVKRKILAFMMVLSILTLTPVITQASAVTFTDVKPVDASYNAITWAVDNGITNGVSKGIFAPNATCNNGQIVTYLWRALGEPSPTSANPFTDISVSNYYYQAALWAHEKGIVGGTAFHAEADCTRLAAVTYLWRAAGSPEPSGSAAFKDVSGDSKAVSWAVEQGITNGFSKDEFRPAATCTRSQIIMFLYRDLVGKYEITTSEGVYEYEVIDGKISTVGRVTFTANDGTTYSGKMVGNKFSGPCVIRYQGGDTYVGDVLQNLKSGSGSYDWANGDSYTGQWENDKMNGQGTYSFAVGGSLTGTFVNDEPNGACVYIDSSGISYNTTWEDGSCVSMTKR